MSAFFHSLPTPSSQAGAEMKSYFGYEKFLAATHSVDNINHKMAFHSYEMYLLLDFHSKFVATIAE